MRMPRHRRRPGDARSLSPVRQNVMQLDIFIACQRLRDEQRQLHRRDDRVCWKRARNIERNQAAPPQRPIGRSGKEARAFPITERAGCAFIQRIVFQWLQLSNIGERGGNADANHERSANRTGNTCQEVSHRVKILYE